MRTPEAIANIRRIVADVARGTGLPAQITCPAPVWDNTNQMIGVVIEVPKVMGGQACMFTASFALTPAEYADVLKITAKASIAMQAIRDSVQCKVRPVKAKAEAA